MKVKVGTQLDAAVHRRLKVMAAANGENMDELINEAIRRLLGRRGRQTLYDRVQSIDERLARIEQRIKD